MLQQIYKVIYEQGWVIYGYNIDIVIWDYTIHVIRYHWYGHVFFMKSETRFHFFFVCLLAKLCIVM